LLLLLELWQTLGYELFVEIFIVPVKI